MASTYSITLSVANSNVGYPADTVPFLPANNQIEDLYATDGGQQLATSDNTRVQVKGPDGSLSYAVIDASRSDPSKNLIFLLPVSP